MHIYQVALFIAKRKNIRTSRTSSFVTTTLVLRTDIKFTTQKLEERNIKRPEMPRLATMRPSRSIVAAIRELLLMVAIEKDNKGNQLWLLLSPPISALYIEV